jgi:hypothetical protein
MHPPTKISRRAAGKGKSHHEEEQTDPADSVTRICFVQDSGEGAGDRHRRTTLGVLRPGPAGRAPGTSRRTGCRPVPRSRRVAPSASTPLADLARPSSVAQSSSQTSKPSCRVTSSGPSVCTSVTPGPRHRGREIRRPFAPSSTGGRSGDIGAREPGGYPSPANSGEDRCPCPDVPSSTPAR